MQETFDNSVMAISNVIEDDIITAISCILEILFLDRPISTPHKVQNIIWAKPLYINATSVRLSDGLNYIDDCADIDIYKDVFKLIFKVMQQESLQTP